MNRVIYNYITRFLAFAVLRLLSHGFERKYSVKVKEHISTHPKGIFPFMQTKYFLSSKNSISSDYDKIRHYTLVVNKNNNPGHSIDECPGFILCIVSFAVFDYLTITFAVCVAVRMMYVPAGSVMPSIAVPWNSRLPSMEYTSTGSELVRREPSSRLVALST